MFIRCFHSRVRATVPRVATVTTCILALILGFSAAPSAMAKPKWLLIPKDDLAMTECKSSPGASAEILLSNRVLDYDTNENYIETYRRIKIYSPKGSEETGILHIDYSSRRNLWNLAARLTKTDGTTTDFDKDSFSETVVEKIGYQKFKRKSLALPNLAPGDILEFQWSQATDDQYNSYFIWYGQENVPVRAATFKVANSTRDFHFFWFNMVKAELKNGDTLEMRDLPAFESEPLMPPMKDVRGWYMILFTHPYLRYFNKPEKLWSEISSYLAEEFKLRTKPGVKMRNLATSLVQGAASDEEKLRLLYDYCRQNIDNFDYFDSPKLQAAKEKLEKNDWKQYADDTLALKTGSSNHVNELFAMLARGAGFEVKLVRCSSRDTVLDIRNMHGWIFIDDMLVAVKMGNEWKLYAPGNYFMPAGMIPFKNEMAAGLYCDEDKVVYVDNPVSPAAKSPSIREGHFTLDAEGTLEGNVEIRMEGHAAASKKSAWNTKTTAEIETDIRSSLTDRLPAAEITDIVVENARTIVMPLTLRYKVKVPGYAEVAGTRIVLPPNYFEHGKPALFTAEIRKLPIFFDYARTEHDKIDIILPEGYALDAPSAPSNVDQNAAVVKADYKIGYKGKSRTLVYERNFVLGAEGCVAFQAASYPVLKGIFERVNRSDEHSLVLKPKAKQPATPAPAAEAPAPSK
ncbi:MAG: DUF3857 and transglutaminase domain-containing protein [Nibricoccus sp.]